MNQITTDNIMKLQDEGVRNLYVRWSRGPEFDTEPSRDYVRWTGQAGLSAVWIDYWERPIMIKRLKEYEFLRIKDATIGAYIYQAEKTGEDWDGYPSINAGSKCLGKWVEE